MARPNGARVRTRLAVGPALPDGPRADLLAMEGAARFEPMAGRPMKEYVTVPAALLANPKDLEPWVARGPGLRRSLPPKAAKTKARPPGEAELLSSWSTSRCAILVYDSQTEERDMIQNVDRLFVDLYHDLASG